MKFDPTKEYWQVLDIYAGVECTCSKIYDTREDMLKDARIRSKAQDDATDSLFYIYYCPEEGPTVGHFSGSDLDESEVEKVKAFAHSIKGALASLEGKTLNETTLEAVLATVKDALNTYLPDIKQE